MNYNILNAVHMQRSNKQFIHSGLLFVVQQSTFSQKWYLNPFCKIFYEKLLKLFPLALTIPMHPMETINTVQQINKFSLKLDHPQTLRYPIAWWPISKQNYHSYKWIWTKFSSIFYISRILEVRQVKNYIYVQPWSFIKCLSFILCILVIHCDTYVQVILWAVLNIIETCRN